MPYEIGEAEVDDLAQVRKKVVEPDVVVERERVSFERNGEEALVQG